MPLPELDVRPGGASQIVIPSLEDNDMPNRAVYLGVVEKKRLVFTGACWTRRRDQRSSLPCTIERNT
jgi:uncharacterized protein YndB with AHSA1/START domain